MGDFHTKMTARRGQVLTSVAASFAAKGYHGVGMREIAQSLGLNQGTLYHHFPSKDAALVAVCQVGQEKTLADLRQAMTNLASFAERVRILFELHLKSLNDCGDFLHVYVDLRGHVPFDLAEPLRSGWREYRKLLTEMFDAAVRGGELPANLDLRHASWMLTAIHRTLNSLHRSLGANELEAFVASACDIYLTGVLAQKNGLAGCGKGGRGLILIRPWINSDFDQMTKRLVNMAFFRNLLGHRICDISRQQRCVWAVPLPVPWARRKIHP